MTINQYKKPIEDRYDVNSFAKAIATCIVNLSASKGTVIALNGPWGVGKSSAVNLARCHLQSAIDKGDLYIVDFSCWWFRGEEELAIAFFRELYAALNPALGERAKKSLTKLASRLLNAGPLLGKIADAAGAAGAGEVGGMAADWLGRLIQVDESVEALFSELRELLAQQQKKFLIIIDDIDRLAPEEAMLIFRLVKSVGQLPNLIYLLVYDRAIAEKIASEKFPSEGPMYLEKIVQASFDIPEPSEQKIQDVLTYQIFSVCSGISGEVERRLHAVVKKFLRQKIKKPRDLVRFINSIVITYAAVREDVDAADFVLLEYIRMYYPKAYAAIRVNKSALVNPSVDTRGRDITSAAYHELFLADLSGREGENLKRIMKFIFPTLENIWGNSTYAKEYYDEWAAGRRVVTERYFENYFRFCVGDGVTKKSDLDLVISKAGDVDYVKTALITARAHKTEEGPTKASVLLEDLEIHSKSVDLEKVEPMLKAIFEIAEELNVQDDKDGSVNNISRIHWLMRALTLERTTLEQRSEIIFSACKNASLLWLAHLARSAFEDHNPPGDQRRQPEENCLLTEHDSVELKNIFLRKINEASETTLLINNPYLARLLYTWNDLSDEGEVSKWLDDQLAHDDSISKLVEVFVRRGWHFEHSAPEIRTPLLGVDLDGMSNLVDVAKFRNKVEEVAAKGSYPQVTEFLQLWQTEEARTSR